MAAAASSCELPSFFKGQLECHRFLQPWLPPLRQSTSVSPGTQVPEYHPCLLCHHQASTPPVPFTWTGLIQPHHLSPSSLSFRSQLQQYLLREDPPIRSPPPILPALTPAPFSPPPAHASFPVWPVCFSSASDTKPEAHAGRGRQCLLHSPLPSLHGTWHVLGALIYFFSE